MRKRIFHDFLWCLPTDFEAVTEYVRNDTAHDILCLIFSFAHLHSRKCANEQKSFSAPLTLFLNGFMCNLEYRCTMEAQKLYWERILIFFPLRMRKCAKEFFLIFYGIFCGCGKAFNCAKKFFFGISLINKRTMMLVSI